MKSKNLFSEYQTSRISISAVTQFTAFNQLITFGRESSNSNDQIQSELRWSSVRVCGSRVPLRRRPQAAALLNSSTMDQLQSTKYPEQQIHSTHLNQRRPTSQNVLHRSESLQGYDLTQKVEAQKEQIDTKCCKGTKYTVGFNTPECQVKSAWEIGLSWAVYESSPEQPLRLI